MGIVSRFLKQVLVYWPPLGELGTGQMRFGTPVEMVCRWTENHEEIVVARGDAILNVSCNSLVLTLIALEEQGVCWLAPNIRITHPAGTALALLVTGGVADPFLNHHAFQVQKVAEIQSVRADESLNKAYL